jgi:drug/metabolite transporter (DMT)-like permease
VTPILYAVVAVICNALSCIIFKHAMRRKDYTWETLIVFHLLAIAILLVFVEIPTLTQLEPSHLFVLIGACLLWVCGDLHGVKAYKHLDASICEMYGTLKLILVTAVGVWIFKESLSGLALLGMGIVIGAIVIQCRMQVKRAVHSSTGMLYILINILFIATALSLDKYLTTVIAEEVIVFYGFLVPAVAYLLLGYKSLPHSISLIRDTGGMFLLAPVFGVISYFCLIKALATGELATTYTVQQTAVIFLLLFEVLFFNARENLKARAAACSACAVGTTMVCVL